MTFCKVGARGPQPKNTSPETFRQKPSLKLRCSEPRSSAAQCRGRSARRVGATLVNARLNPTRQAQSAVLSRWRVPREKNSAMGVPSLCKRLWVLFFVSNRTSSNWSARSVSVHEDKHIKKNPKTEKSKNRVELGVGITKDNAHQRVA